MAVVQMGKHVGQNNEEFLFCHTRYYPWPVNIMQFLPVNRLCRKKSVALIESLPEFFKNIFRRGRRALCPD